MTVAAAARDSISGAVITAGILAVAAGVGALILVARDRIRDARGVPEWKRKRDELKAERLGVALAMLYRGAACVGCAIAGAQLSNRSLGILVVILAGLGLLWVAQNSTKRFLKISSKVTEMEQEKTSSVLATEKK